MGAVFRACLAWFAVLAGAAGLYAQAALAQAPGPVPGLPDFGRYHALVIGNNDYRHLPKLKTAMADARAIAGLLETQYGFQVELMLNAERDQLIRVLNRYRGLLKDSDSLLIYYGGHGVLDEATDRGFWLPVDAEKENEARWLDIATVTGNLRAFQARHVVVIADSCYAGTLVRSAGDPQLGLPADRTVLLQRMRERRARVALVSGGLEPVVDGGGSGHSVFARALLQQLGANRDIISASELFQRLREQVVANARQTPLYSDIRLAGHEGGDFIFVPRMIRPAAPVAIAAAPAGGRDAEVALELAFWDAIKNSAAPADYDAYLEAFPQGRFAPLARRRASPAMAAASPSAPPAVRPAAPSPPPQVATAPAATPAPRPAGQPAIADAAGVAAQWGTIRQRIRQQYDADWARYEQTVALASISDYRVVAVTPEAIDLSLTYTGEAASARPRTTDIRIENRAPGFRILRWGTMQAAAPAAETPQGPVRLASIGDAERVWPVIRRAIERQYAESIRYQTQESRYQSNSVPVYDFRILKNRFTGLSTATVQVEIDYEVIIGRSIREGREARVTLKNDGPDFEIVEWKR